MLSEPSMYTNVQNWAGDLISGNTTTGRILVVFAFACSIAALVLYIWGKNSYLLSRVAKFIPFVYETREVARRVVPLFSIMWPPLETLPCSPRRVRALPPRSFASKILVRPSRITLGLLACCIRVGRPICINSLFSLISRGNALLNSSHSSYL